MGLIDGKRTEIKKLQASVPVCDGAEFKNKLMGFMVYFKPAKINISQYCNFGLRITE
jgi:hypothetical protein